MFECFRNYYVSFLPLVRRASFVVFAIAMILWAWVLADGTALGAEDQREVILSPGRMGPNAFPVPRVGRSRVGSTVDFEMAVENHLNPGREVTVNPFLELYIPVKEVASFSLHSMPIEYFSVSEGVREYRNGKDRSGVSPGDLYVSSSYQLFRQGPQGIDLNFRATTKTTTGKEYENARFFNAPGYIYGLSLGRSNFSGGSGVGFSAMASFIAWQSAVNEQNDAACVGLKLHVARNDWHFEPEIGGYYGWQQNGDQPVSTQMRISKKSRNLDVFGTVRYGIQHQAPLSLKVGAVYKFDFVGKGITPMFAANTIGP